MENKKKDLLSNRIVVALLAIICTALWGTAFPFVKIGYEQFQIISNNIASKLIFAGFRFALAGIIVLLIGFCVNPKAMKPTKKDLLPIGTISFFQTICQYLFFYIGIGYISGTKSALFTSVSTFAVVLISPLFFKADKLTTQKICGCLIGVAGIFIVNFSGNDMLGFTLYGDGLVILSNLCGSAGNITSKKVGQNKNPIMLTGWQLLFGGIVLFTVGFICGGNLHTDDMMGIVNLIYLAAMAGTAFMLWTMLLLHNNVSDVCVYNLLTPVFGTMWSALFLGESLTIINLLSLILVAGGIFLVNFTAKKKN